MSSAISAAPVATANSTISPPRALTAAPAHAPPIPATAAPTPSAATAASGNRQYASLNRLIRSYEYGQSHGADPTVLYGLGQQIIAAARSAGRYVTLPRALAATAAAPAETAKVNVTA
jgi:hypothetical protein